MPAHIADLVTLSNYIYLMVGYLEDDYKADRRQAFDFTFRRLVSNIAESQFTFEQIYDACIDLEFKDMKDLILTHILKESLSERRRKD